MSVSDEERDDPTDCVEEKFAAATLAADCNHRSSPDPEYFARQYHEGSEVCMDVSARIARQCHQSSKVCKNTSTRLALAGTRLSRPKTEVGASVWLREYAVSPVLYSQGGPGMCLVDTPVSPVCSWSGRIQSRPFSRVDCAPGVSSVVSRACAQTATRPQMMTHTACAAQFDRACFFTNTLRLTRLTARTWRRPLAERGAA